MLPSDSQDDDGNRPNFSFANEIFELVVFSTDDVFLQTLRQAVESTRRIWHVPSADKVCDLLLAGEVGILVLDALALSEDVSVFVAQIKRQFPDLVLLVAGGREAEIQLANLISAGTVYRFIHKPMSPGRARLFAETAVRKYVEQRKRAPPAPVRAAPGPGPGPGPGNQRLLKMGSAVLVIAGIAGAWALHHRASIQGTRAQSATVVNSASEASLVARADAALAANRLTAPDNDNALELYQQALARSPEESAAKAGLAQVQERLWTMAMNALLEERLDEAGEAIETARKAGVDGGRIALLTARLAKSREQQKSATTHTRSMDDTPRPGPNADAGRRTELLRFGEARIKEGRLIDSKDDSARYYIREALRLDPTGNAVQAARQSLAAALLAAARADLDHHDFEHAARLIDAADGIGAAANVENARRLLAAARRQAETDAQDRLLKTGRERLQQDRLVEPAADSAKYYLTTLRGINPSNAGLAPALQDLGQRLTANARRALDLKQYEAAHNWLAEAAAVGYSSADSDAVSRELEAAATRQNFLANVVAANDLALVKSVKPVYPTKAEASQTEGWVELDFTVMESGA
ncbi:MAG TPA: tetratricopeptide repeat protein, partial [Steroidobacteraceae bacterium]|nr:tetratricopeptide repeat protein [Steroidobacteraceae bacterium]